MPCLEEDVPARREPAHEDAVDVEQAERAGVDLHDLDVASRLRRARDHVERGMLQLRAGDGRDHVERERIRLARRMHEDVRARRQEPEEDALAERERELALVDVDGGGDAANVVATLDRVDVGERDARFTERHALDTHVPATPEAMATGRQDALEAAVDEEERDLRLGDDLDVKDPIEDAHERSQSAPRACRTQVSSRTGVGVKGIRGGMVRRPGRRALQTRDAPMRAGHASAVESTALPRSSNDGSARSATFRGW